MDLTFDPSFIRLERKFEIFGRATKNSTDIDQMSLSKRRLVRKHQIICFLLCWPHRYYIDTFDRFTWNSGKFPSSTWSILSLNRVLSFLLLGPYKYLAYRPSLWNVPRVDWAFWWRHFQVFVGSSIRKCFTWSNEFPNLFLLRVQRKFGAKIWMRTFGGKFKSVQFAGRFSLISRVGEW